MIHLPNNGQIDLVALAELLTMDQVLELMNRVAARRRLEYRRLRAEGWTLQKIGERDGMTRERVRQILADD